MLSGRLGAAAALAQYSITVLHNNDGESNISADPLQLDGDGNVVADGSRILSLTVNGEVIVEDGVVVPGDPTFGVISDSRYDNVPDGRIVATIVPEPATIAIWTLLGSACLLAYRRRRRR